MKTPGLLRTSALITSLALMAGCAANPADDVPAAELGDPDTGAAVIEPVTEDESAVEVGEADPDNPMDDPASTGDSQAYSDDAATSMSGEYPLYGSISAIGSKVTGSHVIEFTEWTGSLSTDGSAEGSAVSFEVDIDSLVVDPGNQNRMTPKLASHLLTEDFFLVDQHPTGSFETLSVVEGGADGASHTITGNLTLRGITNEISFPATLTIVDGVARASAEFSINRMDWGIAFRGKEDDLIREEVVIRLQLTTDPGTEG